MCIRDSIKVGDEVQILFRNEENIAGTGVVKSVSQSTQTINIDPLFNASGITIIPDTANNKEYDLRRTIKTATSSSVDIEFGNNVLTSDITNVYNDSDERIYVASNSLPSYPITTQIPQSIIPNGTANIDIQGYNPNTLKSVSYTHLTLPTILLV